MTRYLEVKPGSIAEVAIRLRDDYQAYFKKELEKSGKGIAQMTDAEKKAFFNRVDKAYNAKNEAKQETEKTTLVAKPKVKPDDKEEVRRIPVDKLADYKSKGWVEAESFVPEQAKNPYAIGMAAAMKATGDKPPLKKSTITKAHDIAKKVKEEELTAGQKKLPPALQKAIEKKQKNEEVEITETEGGSGGGIDALRAIKAKRLRLQGELDALNKDDPNYKEKAAQKRKEIEAQREIMARKQREVYGSYDPSREDALDLNEITDEEEVDLEEACWTGYKKVGMKKKGDKMVPNCVPEEYVTESGDTVEFVQLDEGQYKEIDIRKSDLKLAKDKRQALKDKYNAIMANQAQGDDNAIGDQIRKLDMSIKKQEQELIDIMKKGKENEKNEAVDPERVQKLNQKIATMTTKVGQLDKSDPANKTKEAILKSDIATAKLRLQDLMQKSAAQVKKAVNEASKAKQSYKTLKMSLKKEQETDNKKKTLTDKPLTKIEVNPKIEG